MRTILVVFAVATLSGCANTRDSRRPACASCDMEKPTLLQRLRSGRPLSETRPDSPPAQVGLAPQPVATGVESVPDASPTPGAEPVGIGKPLPEPGEVRATSDTRKARKPRKSEGRVC